MANYTTVTIDRLVMREDWAVSESGGSDERSIDLSGQETVPRHNYNHVHQLREDFLSLADRLVPVIFTEKSKLNGFYRVDDLDGDLTDWFGELAVFNWEASLVRVGSLSEVDIESRLYGPASKSNNFSVVGSRIHAPAIGHNAYWSGNTAYPTISRATTDGAMTVYTGLASTVHPRWAVSPTDFNKGRVRFIDDNGLERSGKQFNCPATSWELNNGLLRIKPLSSFGILEVSAWDSGAWTSKNWDILAGGVSLTPATHCTMLYNTQEMVIIRLTKSLNPGRVTVDVSLKRGSRFIEVFVQHQFGTTLKVVRATAESGTAPVGAGYVGASANDASGNRYIVGSTKTFTADTFNGGLSIAATPTLDAMIGVELNGSTAIAGETRTDLYAQYIGSPTEVVQAVTR